MIGEKEFVISGKVDLDYIPKFNSLRLLDFNRFTDNKKYRYKEFLISVRYYHFDDYFIFMVENESDYFESHKFYGSLSDFKNMVRDICNTYDFLERRFSK